jgi:hypothetical protein
MYEVFFLRSGAAQAQESTDLVVFSVPNCMAIFSWVEQGDHGGHFTHRHFSNFSIPILLLCTNITPARCFRTRESTRHYALAEQSTCGARRGDSPCLWGT